MTRRLCLMGLALLQIGCATSPTKTTVDARVNHIVLCWLKDPGNAAHRQRIIERTKTLRMILGVLDVKVGESIVSTRAIVDSSFDVALFVTFASKDDMARYLDHPLHKQAIAEVFQPLAQKMVVYEAR